MTFVIYFLSKAPPYLVSAGEGRESFSLKFSGIGLGGSRKKIKQ